MYQLSEGGRDSDTLSVNFNIFGEILKHPELDLTNAREMRHHVIYMMASSGHVNLHQMSVMTSSLM